MLDENIVALNKYLDDIEKREVAWKSLEEEAEYHIEKMVETYRYLMSISLCDDYDFTESMDELIKERLEI